MAKPPKPSVGGGIFNENNIYQGINSFPNGIDVGQNGAITPNYVILPDCPDDTGTMEFGSMCKNPNDGKVYYKDAGGLKPLP